jgi:transposase InsO family protein
MPLPTGPTGPAAAPTRCPPRSRPACASVRRRHPAWGQRRLAHELARCRIHPPGLTSIYRALLRNGLIPPHTRRRRKADYQRWERTRPMELWQLDVMGGIWLADGRELKAVTGIDDHSRFCVAAGLVERANARSVCQVFQATLARYGVPEELLTDNGKVFSGRLGPHPGEVLFDRICRERGITHLLTGIRAPTTTGKIERFHKTLRAELLTGRRFDTLQQAQQVLDAWVADYNFRRPPQAIAMLVPAERFRPVAAATPVPAVQPRRPVAVGPTEITRRVPAAAPSGLPTSKSAPAGTSPARSSPCAYTPPSCRSSSPASWSARCRAAAPRRWSSSKPTGHTGRHDDPNPAREVSTITRNHSVKHQLELDRSPTGSASPSIRRATVSAACSSRPGMTWL